MMPKHTCGTEMREAIYREKKHLGQEYLAGDYGKIWVCDTCNVLVVCST